MYNSNIESINFISEYGNKSKTYGKDYLPLTIEAEINKENIGEILIIYEEKANRVHSLHFRNQ